MSMSYTHTQTTPVLRLGLLARWHAAREARMISQRKRRKLAKSIERAITRASGPPPFYTAVIPVAREAAGEAGSALHDLAERLRSPEPVDPDGVRLARALITDGAGPLYVPQEPGELRGAALRALWALDGRGATG
jgi:hypothetical protein